MKHHHHALGKTETTPPLSLCREKALADHSRKNLEIRTCNTFS